MASPSVVVSYPWVVLEAWPQWVRTVRTHYPLTCRIAADGVLGKSVCCLSSRSK
jgi:hypothetical protein